MDIRKHKRVMSVNKKGLTLTVVFEAESANYGEGMGNITMLKKMSRSDGNIYSYISRQALRYNIVQQAGWDDTPVNSDKGTVQFDPSTTIVDYPEIDLFGYMKTRSKSEEDAGGADIRSAAARLSNAISLEPFRSDIDFMTNMGLAKRADLQNGIMQSEIHHSNYSYTVSIDLDRIGEDGKISLSPEEKAKRVCTLLETIQFLFRDIKGRRENMAPVFVIGGVFDRKTPYFEGRCTLSKNSLNISRLKEVVESCNDSKENTHVGYLNNSFSNDEEIVKELKAESISAVFSKLQDEVRSYYG